MTTATSSAVDNPSAATMVEWACGPQTSSQDSPSENAPKGPALTAWDLALVTYRRWVGPADEAAVRIARQRFLAHCRTCTARRDFAEAAPLVAFGFLTHAAYDAARRTSRIFRG